MSLDTENQLKRLYKTYNDSVKLLIADLEARNQSFPIEIFNEIRAFTDHVARCYLPGKTEEDIQNELVKAEGHIIRTLLDCYKCLNVYFFDTIEHFEKKDMKYVDLSYVDNGRFMITLRNMKNEAVAFSREARRYESQDKAAALQYYEKMYLKYVEIETYIENNSAHLLWAKDKFFKNKARSFVVWLLTLLAGVVISWIFQYFILQ